jgi:hypothetical protein
MIKIELNVIQERILVALIELKEGYIGNIRGSFFENLSFENLEEFIHKNIFEDVKLKEFILGLIKYSISAKRDPISLFGTTISENTKGCYLKGNKNNKGVIEVSETIKNKIKPSSDKKLKSGHVFSIKETSLFIDAEFKCQNIETEYFELAKTKRIKFSDILNIEFGPNLAILNVGEYNAELGRITPFVEKYLFHFDQIDFLDTFVYLWQIIKRKNDLINVIVENFELYDRKKSLIETFTKPDPFKTELGYFINTETEKYFQAKFEYNNLKRKLGNTEHLKNFDETFKGYKKSIKQFKFLNKTLLKSLSKDFHEQPNNVSELNLNLKEIPINAALVNKIDIYEKRLGKLKLKLYNLLQIYKTILDN